MSFKHRVRKVVVCLVLGMGMVSGMPMRPDEIEELMHTMNQPKVVNTKPDGGESGDERTTYSTDRQ